MPENIREQIKVEFRGTIVKDILNHNITLYNNGNKVIERHRIYINLMQDSEILHVDPGDRFEIEESSNDSVSVFLKFLNPGETAVLRVHTTGDPEDEIKIVGEGPGVKFKVADSLLPVLDPNATQKDLGKMFRKMQIDSFKRLGWKIALIYSAILALTLILIDFFD